MTLSPPSDSPEFDAYRGGLALVGYRGTGKSSVGRIVAGQLGRPFADADAELERRLGRTVSEVFAEEGEAGFREHEQTTLAELATRSGWILATGGGAVLREANRRLLRTHGVVVWLRASTRVIVERLRQDETDRPALTPAGALAEVEAVYREREPLYRQTADFSVETDGKSLEDVTEEVLKGWRDFIATLYRGNAEPRSAGGWS